MEDSRGTSPESPDSDKEYKTYCSKESDEAYSTIAKNQEEYDKQLLTLSTGLLAVLVAFLKDVVHLDSAIDRPLLYFGFAGLGLTILFVIVSFQVSIYALEEVRKYYQKHFEGKIDYPFPNLAGKWVKYINWGGGASFILGVALALGFITLNLAHQAHRGDTKNEVRDGSRGCGGQISDSGRSGASGYHN